MRHSYQLAPPVAFLHLTVDQSCLHLPAAQSRPLAKVGGEGIKVEIEPIIGEERKAVRSKALSQRVDEPMGHGLCSGAKLKHGKELRQGIDGQPQPGSDGRLSVAEDPFSRGSIQPLGQRS